MNVWSFEGFDFPKKIEILLNLREMERDLEGFAAQPVKEKDKESNVEN